MVKVTPGMQRMIEKKESFEIYENVQELLLEVESLREKDKMITAMGGYDMGGPINTTQINPDKFTVKAKKAEKLKKLSKDLRIYKK